MYCPVCDSQQVQVHRIAIDAAEIGLPSGTLEGVEEIRCDECGEETLNVPAQAAVIKEYRNKLASVDRRLEPAEFAFLRRQLGVSGKDYASALGVSNVTISRVENGEDVPSIQEATVRGLTLLDLITDAAIKQLRERPHQQVIVDVQAIERSRPREITQGWETLEPDPLPMVSNVVALRSRPLVARTVESVEFYEDRRAYACH